MSKKKRSKKSQLKIASEVIEQKTVRQLKAQVKFLKRVPKDFRDIDPGSPDWEKFADVTGRRKEMEAWASGLVLCLKEPSSLEKSILGSCYVIKYELGQYTWSRLLPQASEDGYSWIYLPNEEPKVIDALNILLSRFEYTVRVRGQIKSEHSGHPIGVAH